MGGCDDADMEYSFILVNHFDSAATATATDVVAAADAADAAVVAMDDDEFTLYD